MTATRRRGVRLHSTSVALLFAAGLAAAMTMPQNVAAQSSPAEITWIRQFGTAVLDRAWGTDVDAAGNVYTAGVTAGALPGQISAGGSDAFVRKYDPAGTEMWTQQFGTAGEDLAWDVAVDRAVGSVYVVGFLGNIGAFNEHNAYLRKYNSSGFEVWTRQIGQVSEAQGVTVDPAGNIYIAGFVTGTLPGQTSAGSTDAFVRKYDSAGNVLWTRQFGSPSFDSASRIAADQAGNVAVVGTTTGALPGQVAAGAADDFVRQYDFAGNELWTRQFGSADFESATGVAVDQLGNVFVSGQTQGALPGQISAGSSDAFI